MMCSYHFLSRTKIYSYPLPANTHRLRVTGLRMSSTLVGSSGRVYVRDRVLKAHPRRPELNIYLAQ